jgi:hypothetical protein
MPKSKKQSRAIPLISLGTYVACEKGETYPLNIFYVVLFEAVI